jgi:Ca-activated chloride channel family protein
MPFASTCPDGQRSRRRARFASGLVALGAWAAVVQAQEPVPNAVLGSGPQATFRAETDLVVLQVSVVDPERRFVSDLVAADFGVYEEGERQQVATFVSITAPLDLMVLLDTSSSMGPNLRLVQRAAMTLIRALKRQDRAAVVLFNDNVQLKEGLTSDTRRLESAIRNSSARGTTALYEALYLAQHELARARPAGDELRRQAVVVLTDGDDTRSRLSYADVLEQARRSPVTIFTITPSLGVETARQIEYGRGIRFGMRELAETTGGRAFAPAGFADVEPIYAEIAAELSQQYWLGYVPTSAGEAGFRRVSVRVETRAGLRARTRSGYYVSTSRRAAVPSIDSGTAR